MKNRMPLILGFVLGFALLSPLRAGAEGKKQLWLYTSIFKEFISPIKAEFERQNPGIELEVFQAGSEKLQQKVEAELLSKKIQADLVLCGDQFWAWNLDHRGLLYQKDKAPTFGTYSYSLMVMIAHKSVPEAQRPKTFLDLAQPQYKNKIHMGSPLESGTMFSMVAYLSSTLGWDYFAKLRENNIGSNGGNSAVIQKVESGEKKFGIVLLESALVAQKRGSPIDVIYPVGGGIPTPGAYFTFKDSPHPDLAQLFIQFALSQKGQMLMKNGYMYSVRKDVPAPDGARPFAEVTKNPYPWTPEFVKTVATSAGQIKKKFSNDVLE